MFSSLDGNPRSNAQCKVCQLIATSEDLATILHEYRFAQKMKLRPLAKAMEPHIDGWNKKNPDKILQSFSIKSIATHYNKHAPAQEQIAYQMQNKLNETRHAGIDRQVSPVVQQHIEQQITKSVSIFEEMTDLFTKLKKMFDEYYADKPKVGPLTIHLDIIREMRKTLTEISKMRQSKELVKIAVRSVIDTYLTSIIDTAGVSIDQLRERLIKKFGDPIAVDVFMEEFRKTMVDAVIESARVAVDRVRVEFALDDKETS